MSAELKFEKEQDNSQLVDLNDMSAKVEAAINDEKNTAENAAPSARGASDSSFLLDAALMVVTESPIVHAVGAALMVSSFMSSQRPEDKPPSPASNSIFLGSAKAAPKKSNSIFVKSGNDTQQMRATGVSMVPAKTAADSKMVKKMGGKPGGDLLARANLSRMSLTGSTTQDPKPQAIKGLKVSKKDAAAVSPELINTLNNLENAKKGPMSAARLVHGLNAGHENAEQAIKEQKPEVQKTVLKKQQFSAPAA